MSSGPAARRVLAVVLGLLILELAIVVACHLGDRRRIFAWHPVAGHAPLPDLDRRRRRCGDRVFHVSTGPDRFRVTGPRPVDPRAGHVLLLGDSFAFGWCVDDEESLGWILSDTLDRPVVNLSANAYGPDVSLALLRDHLGRAAPVEAVVVVLFENDPWDVTYRRSRGRARPHHEVDPGRTGRDRYRWVPARRGWRDVLLDRSYVAALLARLVLPHGTPTAATGEDVVPLVTICLEEMAREAAGRGIPIAFFYADRLDGAPGAVEPRDRLLADRALGIEDLTPILRDARADVGTLLAPDGHWNRDGARVAAGRIREVLARRGARAEETGRVPAYAGTRGK